ncbi:MAG: glycosyltransferase family 39 protein [Proteobacteria bacterium]|nr:glycosyltransferase family 39 protein [Pseudomonadota bacterium]
MRKTTNWVSENTGFYLVFSIIVGFGTYLRLDQFFLQVLLDDEWHAVHQLINKSTAEIFLSFGHADFSIPLTLFYWLELKSIGLSELGMRWPLMLAGVISLLVFPLFIRKYFNDRIVLVFTFLLSVSPLLIIYSRTARPYALTLLLTMIALAAFYRFAASGKFAWKPALVYMLSSILCTWMHLISLPFVVAPFVALGLPALLSKDWHKIRYFLYLGLMTLTGMLALVLPPMLAHPQALEAKLGLNTPGLETIYGAGFAWFGVSEPIFLGFLLLLAIAGFSRLRRSLPLVDSLLVAIVITLVVIQLSQPDWVQYAQTFARYLLPVVPLLLLAAAIGFSRLIGLIGRLPGYLGKLLVTLVLFSGSMASIMLSPLPGLLAVPNSNSLHIVYQLDFRDVDNEVDIYQQKNFPLSPFWQLLAGMPVDSLKIAASPFYFESYNWDAPRWEHISHQRIMPGFLNGFCSEMRWGEVPAGRGFNFNNAAFTGNMEDLLGKEFDLVVYQKPHSFTTAQGTVELGKETSNCGKILADSLPAPVYEDDLLVAYPLTKKARRLINAER